MMILSWLSLPAGRQGTKPVCRQAGISFLLFEILLPKAFGIRMTEQK